MNVKALIFDTFQTVVDWRGSIIKEGWASGKGRGINIDWAFVKTCRAWLIKCAPESGSGGDWR